MSYAVLRSRVCKSSGKQSSLEGSLRRWLQNVNRGSEDGEEDFTEGESSPLKGGGGFPGAREGRATQARDQHEQRHRGTKGELGD